MRCKKFLKYFQNTEVYNKVIDKTILCKDKTKEIFVHFAPIINNCTSLSREKKKYLFHRPMLLSSCCCHHCYYWSIITVIVFWLMHLRYPLQRKTKTKAHSNKHIHYFEKFILEDSFEKLIYILKFYFYVFWGIWFM